MSDSLRPGRLFPVPRDAPRGLSADDAAATHRRRLAEAVDHAAAIALARETVYAKLDAVTAVTPVNSWVTIQTINFSVSVRSTVWIEMTYQWEVVTSDPADRFLISFGGLINGAAMPSVPRGQLEHWPGIGGGATLRFVISGSGQWETYSGATLYPAIFLPGNLYTLQIKAQVVTTGASTADLRSMSSAGLFLEPFGNE